TPATVIGPVLLSGDSARAAESGAAPRRCHWLRITTAVRAMALFIGSHAPTWRISASALVAWKLQTAARDHLFVHINLNTGPAHEAFHQPIPRCSVPRPELGTELRADRTPVRLLDDRQRRAVHRLPLPRHFADRQAPGVSRWLRFHAQVRLLPRQLE